MRSRGVEGKTTAGAESEAHALPGASQALAAMPAHCPKNSLRVVAVIRESVAEMDIAPGCRNPAAHTPSLFLHSDN